MPSAIASAAYTAAMRGRGVTWRTRSGFVERSVTLAETIQREQPQRLPRDDIEHLVLPREQRRRVDQREPHDCYDAQPGARVADVQGQQDRPQGDVQRRREVVWQVQRVQ